jgi:DNA-binding NtrC family response regulator
MNKKNILIVDDELEIIEYVKKFLEEEGYNVILEETGKKALNLLYSGKIDIDLVITDISMPDMDGYELYKRIMMYDSDIPVIMMTGFGYDPNHAVVKSKKEGLAEVIFKPVPKKRLIELVKKYLD